MARYKKVTAMSGDSFDVDTSDEACKQFGFHSGDVINNKDFPYLRTVVGVAHSHEWDNGGNMVLWFMREGYDDRVFFTEKTHIHKYFLVTPRANNCTWEEKPVFETPAKEFSIERQDWEL